MLDFWGVNLCQTAIVVCEKKEFQKIKIWNNHILDGHFKPVESLDEEGIGGGWVDFWIRWWRIRGTPPKTNVAIDK